MKPLEIAAAGLLALHAQSAIAQSVPAPPSEAAIQRFLASLPPDPLAGRAEPDPEQLRKLTTLNPGKAAQVKAILGDFDGCISAAAAAGARRMLRSVALELGAEKVERLTDFYRSPDLAVFTAIQARLSATKPPSAPDAAELKRLTAAYPLSDLSQAMKRAGQRVRSDAVFDEAARQCGQTRNAALAGAKIALR